MTEAEFDREKRELWPLSRMRSSIMLFERGIIDLSKLDELLDREIKNLREAGVERMACLDH